jgi:copper resistance protein D
VDDPLIYVRAIHFAATITVAGVVFFIVFIAAPAFRAGDADARVPAIVQPRFAWIAWISLLLTVLSGAAWLLLVTEDISERSIVNIFSDGGIWTVLLQTGFGRVWLARFVMACLLAAVFAPFLSARGGTSVLLKLVAVALAAGIVGTLTKAGHAAGGPGLEGILHPAADALHLVAAAAWVGMLLPLALVLAAASKYASSVAIARGATVRFSTIGIGSVATLLGTGSINTWYLAGSVPALTDSDYGRLLLVKIALFLGMVAIAAVNRLGLTPRVAPNGSGTREALRKLRRNTAIEVATGAVIIAIVAVLGVTPPGLHDEITPHAHHHSD